MTDRAAIWGWTDWARWKIGRYLPLIRLFHFIQQLTAVGIGDLDAAHRRFLHLLGNG
ncbi:MAG: hypothetical protein M5U34_05420 [Chloroflexi bacterium]|nr:hypothetical protein [Chloroflexota bacterium]